LDVRPVTDDVSSRPAGPDTFARLRSAGGAIHRILEKVRRRDQSEVLSDTAFSAVGKFCMPLSHV
jgi:hypothetical protein